MAIAKQSDHTRVWSIDEVIRERARAQLGLVARRQLLALGLSRRGIEHRLARGVLVAVHRGVYTFTPAPLTRDGRLLAAILAGGPRAALSHRSAAARFGLPVTERRIEITVPMRRSVPGITSHVSSLLPDEHEHVEGLPMTTVARTLLDLADTLTHHELEKAFNEADYLRLTSPVGLPELLRRHPRRPGSARLRAILADHTVSTAWSETDLEADFAAFLTDHALLWPRRQHPVLGYRVDCAWPDRRLIVELDGRAAHATASRFDGDRMRDRELALAGWTVIRVTNRMLRSGREALARDLGLLLGHYCPA
jgi:very-short-patch-repair endonuclease